MEEGVKGRGARQVSGDGVAAWCNLCRITNHLPLFRRLPFFVDNSFGRAILGKRTHTMRASPHSSCPARCHRCLGCQLGLVHRHAAKTPFQLSHSGSRSQRCRPAGPLAPLLPCSPAPLFPCPGSLSPRCSPTKPDMAAGEPPSLLGAAPARDQTNVQSKCPSRTSSAMLVSVSPTQENPDGPVTTLYPSRQAQGPRRRGEGLLPVAHILGPANNGMTDLCAVLRTTRLLPRRRPLGRQQKGGEGGGGHGRGQPAWGSWAHPGSLSARILAQTLTDPLFSLWVPAEPARGRTGTP